MIKRLIFLLPSILLGRANPGFFEQFPNRHFVETGSYLGNGIEAALHAGFENIHSIELGEWFYNECMKKFEPYPHVHIWFGDSGLILSRVIEEIREPITFWLDGHWSDGGTAKGSTFTPVLKELEAIQKHPIKNHTILIDDIRCFGTADFDFIELSEIVQKIKEINPDYVITYQDGFQPNDILIAQAPSLNLSK
jgi:hypothetical protein